MNIDDLKGCFANITDDELLRDSGNLYAENKELKQKIERLNNNWNKLKNELKNILFFDNDTITYEDLMDIVNRIEESDK